MNLVKGEGTLYPRAGKSFDPILIPKAIHDAGFTATEVEIVLDGTLTNKKGALELEVLGLKHPFILAGGAQKVALKEDGGLIARRIRVTGKVHLGQDGLPPTLSVESFRPSP